MGYSLVVPGNRESCIEIAGFPGILVKKCGSKPAGQNYSIGTSQNEQDQFDFNVRLPGTDMVIGSDPRSWHPIMVIPLFHPRASWVASWVINPTNN